MKSSSRQLESRGYLEAGFENSYVGLSFAERVQLLKSRVPVDRTIGARLLKAQYEFVAIAHLLEALKTEKKIYPKIEICNSLASYGAEVCTYLIPLLGKIGSNQHTKIPVGGFKKDSYPLPRDIVSRIFIRIGTSALPYLLRCLTEKDSVCVSEAVDAVGFICFYKYQTGVYDSLMACFENKTVNDLIKFKVFRALSACPESELFLSEQRMMHTGPLLFEIERSLRVIRKRRLRDR